MVTEAELQEQVAEYLRRQYPDILFHSDYGSGARLTPKQAAMQKRQNGGRRAWPDLFIAEERRWSQVSMDAVYGGLFIELKREGTRLKKKNGEWTTPHIAEQAELMKKLVRKGYCARFACGFDEAKEIIDNYLKGAK